MQIMKVHGPQLYIKNTLFSNEHSTTLKTLLEAVRISGLGIQGILSCNKMLPQSLSPA